MADMATVRRVTLDDGTTAELDGDTLTMKHNAAGETITAGTGETITAGTATPGSVLNLSESDKDALIWLLRGTSPRKDRGTQKGTRKAKGALDTAPADTEAAAAKA
jgi:hypothetical protein